MDISAALAAQKYQATKPATAPDPTIEQVASGAQSFLETLQSGENTAKAAMMGEADPHALVQALSQTKRAVETAVVVRDKVVEAYQEILRMPV